MKTLVTLCALSSICMSALAVYRGGERISRAIKPTMLDRTNSPAVDRSELDNRPVSRSITETRIVTAQRTTENRSIWQRIKDWFKVGTQPTVGDERFVSVRAKRDRAMRELTSDASSGEQVRESFFDVRKEADLQRTAAAAAARKGTKTDRRPVAV